MSFDLATQLIHLCTQKGVKIATAESCTGGLLGGAITDISGSAGVYDRGFITYSNEAKLEMLDLDEKLLAENGAVSEAVAKAMVYGALTRSDADIAVATTGIAGPTGGTPEKPVGLVFIAAGSKFGKVACEEHVFPGSRENVRVAAVEKALSMLYDIACAFE